MHESAATHVVKESINILRLYSQRSASKTVISFRDERAATQVAVTADVLRVKATTFMWPIEARNIPGQLQLVERWIIAALRRR